MALSALASATVLLVRLYHGDDLHTHDAQAARLEAQTILQAAGMKVDAILCAAGPQPGRCGQPVAPTELVVRMRAAGAVPESGPISMGFAALGDGSLGVPTLATVFVDRVAAVARAAGGDPRQLLGRAVAHEIGHLLLNKTAHSTHGLMRAVWSAAEVRRNLPTDWRFQAREARTMRRAFEARSSSAAGPRDERGPDRLAYAQPGRSAHEAPVTFEWAASDSNRLFRPVR